MLIVSAAVAQETDEGTATRLEEVTVSAQRHEERLSDVPIAVSVLSAADVRNAGITDMQALNGSVPSLRVMQGGPGNVFFIRGVGSPLVNANGEQSVATYVDGVYMYAPFGNTLPLGADLDHIEVLKGPQGTLFGRNSTGGVIQIITKDPQQAPAAEVTAGYGNFNTVTADLYATAGVTATLAGDISVSLKHMGDGYGENIFNGKQTYKTSEGIVRSKWLWTPDDLTKIRATFSYSKIDGGYGVDFQVMPGHRQLDGAFAQLPPFDTNEDNQNSVHGQIYLTSLQFDRDLGFGKLENIVSYRDVSKFIVNFDDDVTPNPLVGATENDPSKTFTEELRLLAPEAAKIQWVVGTFYINGKVAFDPLGLTGSIVAPPPVELFERDSQKLWSVAPYGQATAEIFDKAFLTAGVRYNYEHLSTTGTSVEIPLADQFIPGLPQQQTDRNTSWRVALDYKWNSDLMTYVSASRGYKSGGYNLVNLVAGKEPPPYLPEKLTAYETGLKAELLDHRVALNASAYYYRYQNIQVQTAVPGGSVTSNGPLATLEGFDADVNLAVTRHFNASAAINYVEGSYGSFPGALAYASDPFAGTSLFDATGKSTIYTPRWSGNLAADYTIPTAVGDFALNVNASSTAKVYVAVTNRLTVPGYVVANSSVTWTAPDTQFSVRLWVLNAFDKEYVVNRLETSEGDWQLWAPPRTYGVSLEMGFGGH